MGKVASLLGMPIATAIINFADSELPKPLTGTAEDIVRMVIVGILVYYLPHDLLNKLWVIVNLVKGK